jgi:hypothetical protein
MISSSFGGSSGFNRVGEVGAVCRMAPKMMAEVLPGKGSLPVAIWYNTTPIENRSVRVSNSSPRACSGVSHRTERRAGAGQVLFGDSRRVQLRSSRFCDSPFSLAYLGQPEVQNLRVTTIRNKNVCGLDVTVNNSLRVRRVQRICNFRPQLQQLLDREGPSSESMLQRLPFHQFHGNEELAIAFVNVVNRTDVWVVESRCGTSFSTMR